MPKEIDKPKKPGRGGPRENSGGARKGAGRKPNSVNKKTKAIAAELATKIETKEIVSPLEVMMTAMNHYFAIYTSPKTKKKSIIPALEAAARYAAQAAPYLHARLQATTLKGDADAPLAVTIIDDIPDTD